jgi:hypothetical protein
MRRSNPLPTFAVLALCAGLPGVAAAQTPLPSTAPKVEIKWLASLGLSPSSHYVSPTAGGRVVGTLTLLRPAVASTTVTLSMTGATTTAEGPMLLADGASLPRSITIPAGSNKGSFTVTTFKGTWWGTKKFTVDATLGSERVSASFDLTTRQ